MEGRPARRKRSVTCAAYLISFAAISVVIENWYDHVPLNDRFVLFVIVLLVSFSIS